MCVSDYLHLKVQLKDSRIRGVPYLQENEKRIISPILRALSRWLSGACLGKTIVFRYKLLKRCALFALPVAPSRGLDGLQASPARPGCPA